MVLLTCAKLGSDHGHRLDCVVLSETHCCVLCLQTIWHLEDTNVLSWGRCHLIGRLF